MKLPFLVFFDDVGQAEDKLIGFGSRHVRRKDQRAVVNALRNHGGSEPAAHGVFFRSPLAENGEVFAEVRGGILFENHGTAFVEIELDGEAAFGVDELGGDEIGFGEERFLVNGQRDWVSAKNGDGLGGLGVVGLGLEMNANGAGLFFFLFFFGLATAKKRQGQRQREIEIELLSAKLHSDITKPHHAKKVKHYGKTIQQSHQAQTSRELSETQGRASQSEKNRAGRGGVTFGKKTEAAREFGRFFCLIDKKNLFTAVTFQRKWL
ncbi:MAG TPA: hypothetical protein VMH30_13570 [Verrucomicrobiae bacterium]|nr:hypothetical protein [Verrucomicrobiae bacterium]